MIALLVGIAVGAKVQLEQRYPVLESQVVGHAGDFTWTWGAARDVLAGRNPYTDPPPPERIYTHGAPLWYPLPAVLASLPVAPLPAVWAGSVFMGAAAVLLTVGLLRHDAWRALLTPAFFVGTTVLNPWSTLLVGLALLWPRLLASLVLLKTNVGLALFARQPSWASVKIAAVVGAASLLVLPTWPLDWLRNVSEHRHTIPALTLPFGPLIGLLWLGRQDPAARSAMVLALVPQRIVFYDQLLLLLVAKTKRQWAFVVLTSQAAFLAWVATSGRGGGLGNAEPTMLPWVMAGCYLPAIAVVVWNRLRPAAEFPVDRA